MLALWSQVSDYISYCWWEIITHPCHRLRNCLDYLGKEKKSQLHAYNSSTRRCACLLTWFCYQMIAKPGNKAGPLSWLLVWILNTAINPITTTHAKLYLIFRVKYYVDIYSFVYLFSQKLRWNCRLMTYLTVYKVRPVINTYWFCCSFYLAELWYNTKIFV